MARDPGAHGLQAREDGVAHGTHSGRSRMEECRLATAETAEPLHPGLSGAQSVFRADAGDVHKIGARCIRGTRERVAHLLAEGSERC